MSGFPKLVDAASVSSVPINALVHGVKGDGTPEGSAIQAFLDAFAGQAVQFPYTATGYNLDTVQIALTSTHRDTVIHFERTIFTSNIVNDATFKFNGCHGLKTIGPVEINCQSAVGSIGLLWEQSVSYADLDSIYIHHALDTGMKCHNNGLSGGHYYNRITKLRIENCGQAISCITDTGGARINSNHIDTAMILFNTTGGILVNNADECWDFDYLDCEQTTGDAINLVKCLGFHVASGWIEGNTVSLRIANDPDVRGVFIRAHFDTALNVTDAKLVYNFNRSRSIEIQMANTGIGVELGRAGFVAIGVGPYGTAADDIGASIDSFRISAGIYCYRLSPGNPTFYFRAPTAGVGFRWENNDGTNGLMALDGANGGLSLFNSGATQTGIFKPNGASWNRSGGDTFLDQLGNGDLVFRFGTPTERVRFKTGGGIQMADATDLTFGASTGTKIGGTGAKLALYGTTPILQPSRPGQLTDSSGGTSGGSTIAAIGGAVDPTAALRVDTANAVATLAAKVNALETVLHNLGAVA